MMFKLAGEVGFSLPHFRILLRSELLLKAGLG